MYPGQAWLHTVVGTVQGRARSAGLWLGIAAALKLTPVLFLVAIAMGVGTYLESAYNVRVARQYVYGSSWFLGVMGLVCVL